MIAATKEIVSLYDSDVTVSVTINSVTYYYPFKLIAALFHVGSPKRLVFVGITHEQFFEVVYCNISKVTIDHVKFINRHIGVIDDRDFPLISAYYKSIIKRFLKFNENTSGICEFLKILYVIYTGDIKPLTEQLIITWEGNNIIVSHDTGETFKISVTEHKQNIFTYYYNSSRVNSKKYIIRALNIHLNNPDFSRNVGVLDKIRLYIPEEIMCILDTKIFLEELSEKTVTFLKEFVELV